MRWGKTLIERAYTLGAALGLAVWCEDEAGPKEAVGWYLEVGFAPFDREGLVFPTLKAATS